MKRIIIYLLFYISTQSLLAQGITITAELPATQKRSADIVTIRMNKEGLIKEISHDNPFPFSININGNSIKLNDGYCSLMLKEPIIDYVKNIKKSDGKFISTITSKIKVNRSGPIVFDDFYQDKLNEINGHHQLIVKEDGSVQEDTSIKYNNGVLIYTINGVPQFKKSYRLEGNIIYVDQFYWMGEWVYESVQPVKIVGAKIFSNNRFLNTINYYILQSYGADFALLFLPILFSMDFT